MSTSRPPRLEPRRFGDFEKELLDRARAWIPSWSLDDGENDFGRALLTIAARFNAQVAERLDHAGDKMERGFLDWLAVRGEAARPARMPVVFKLAEAAHEPVYASHPVLMQVDAHSANVSFETETDVQLIPGRLELIVGVDPSRDTFFLPPPGLNSLEPIEPLPTQWRLKSFAAPGSKILQLDPSAGLREGMLVEIRGTQYRIFEAKDGLVTIDSVIPDGDGFTINTLVNKVEVFDPFKRARDQQNHILYLGHADLFNIEAQATIDVIGAQSLGPDVTWEYWGKAKNAATTDAEPRWRELRPAEIEQQKVDALVLVKPNGTIEPLQIGASESRWIRARKAHLDGQTPSLTTESIALCINATSAASPAITAFDPSTLLSVDVVVNTTPSPANDFYPLGREPRISDSFYLGCIEAFSKKGATAKVHFDLTDSSFIVMAAYDGSLLGPVLAGVDKTGSLHLFSIGSSGALTRLNGRAPLRPSAVDSTAESSVQGVRLSSSTFRPVMWNDDDNLFVAVTAGNEIWVWKEAGRSRVMSEWEFWGSIPPDVGSNKIIEGLVAIEAEGHRTLAALRNGRLWICKPDANPTWDPLSINVAANEVIELIASVGSDASDNLSDTLLAVAKEKEKDETSPVRTLYSVTSTTINKLLSNVAKNVAPFGVKRINSNSLQVITVKDTLKELLAWQTARQTGDNLSSISFDGDLSISNSGTFIDGRIENGEITAYVLANLTSGPPELLAWKPFDPSLKDIVFLNRFDNSVGKPKASITLFNDRAYLPGSNEGEILGLALGTRLRKPIKTEIFISALAIPYPAPALTKDDIVVIDHKLAKVVETPPVVVFEEFTNYSFFWLSTWINHNTKPSEILAFATSSSGLTGTLQDNKSLKLANGDGITVDMFLLVKDKDGLKLVKITSFDKKNEVATLAPSLSASAGECSYFLPKPINGRVFPALTLDSSNNDWNIDLLPRAGLYFPKETPIQQRAIAVSYDPQLPKRPQQIALLTAWSKDPQTAASTEFIVDSTIASWKLLRGDTSTNPVLTWEYWNGAGWWRLDIIEDYTHNLKNSGSVAFKVPADLRPVDWVGKTSHWIRARLTGGDYGQETVIVKTKPVATETGPGTEQTVERSTEGIQPPYALNVLVHYSVDEAVLPTFLLTQDSGTLRNQSDANRTPDAHVEIFTPLAYALRRFEAPITAASRPEGCAPDCEYFGDLASASPERESAAPIAAPIVTTPMPSANRRSLYLGFDSKLSGEPVNVLLLVDKERSHDKFAPLTVEALLADRFVPVIAKDETRGLGETGLVSMSIDTVPTPTELFGRSLSWVRLTPAASDGSSDWAPALRGVYLNAIWTRAAETMTRELVGSSEGAPNLILQLARPPLLSASLELRVKEPLSKEERDRLAEGAPDTVKSDVAELPGHWVLWTQVADPADYEATARVYALDEATGTIRFGDGLHGAIPPIGPDVIVAFKYERTEPATGDDVVPANFVAARSSLNLVTPIESVEAAIAADQSAGGVAPETGERVLRFGTARLRHRGRALIARDFEELALEQFAEVTQARCFSRDGRIRLVIVMRGTDPMPNQAERRELRRVLLTAAPAALQAPGMFRVEGPKVRQLRIKLKLRVATLDAAGALASYVKTTLRMYFDTDTGGMARKGRMLGSSPNEDDIAEALLDAPNLESIASIILLEVDTHGGEHAWPQAIAASELAMLADDNIHIGFEIVEVME